MSFVSVSHSDRFDKNFVGEKKLTFGTMLMIVVEGVMYTAGFICIVCIMYLLKRWFQHDEVPELLVFGCEECGCLEVGAFT
jgi:hypothetical protein